MSSNEKTPAGYDPGLWNSIPSVRAKKHPGKHETYVFGQGSADGTTCIGCPWQVPDLLNGPVAVARHDQDMHLIHDHDTWVRLKGTSPHAGACPCQNEKKHQES